MTSGVLITKVNIKSEAMWLSDDLDHIFLIIPVYQQGRPLHRKRNTLAQFNMHLFSIQVVFYLFVLVWDENNSTFGQGNCHEIVNHFEVALKKQIDATHSDLGNAYETLEIPKARTVQSQ